MKNILITGSNGLLGSEFKELLSPSLNYFATHKDCDITNIDSIRNFCKNKKIDFILNCAADRNAEKMENNYDDAYKITVEGPKNLAIIAEEIGACIIHFSSDYVFDGSKTLPYTETDKTHALSVYGKLKIQGEQAVLENCKRSIIIRTAWLFSYYGKDFVKTINNLAKTQKEIKVVFDQVGSPCYANDLAKYVLEILPDIQYHYGEIYHLTNEGVCSWYDLAHQIVTMFNLNCKILPIHSNEFFLNAKRPSYSVLDKSKIKNHFQLNIRHYSEGLKDCINKIKRNNNEF